MGAGIKKAGNVWFMCVSFFFFPLSKTLISGLVPDGWMGWAGLDWTGLDWDECEWLDGMEIPFCSD